MFNIIDFMDYSDIEKIKPVIEYDVNGGKIAYIIREKIPTVYIHGYGGLDHEFYANEVKWLSNGKLAVVGDQEGREKREIYIYDGKFYPLLKDNYDNYNPKFIEEDKFFFISNRDGKTLSLFLYEKGEIEKISKGDLPVSSYCVSDDGTKIAYSQGIYDDDIYLIDFKKREEVKISFKDSEQVIASERCFSDRGLLFLSNNDDFLNIALYDGEVKWILKSNHDKYEALLYNGNLIYIEDVRGDFQVKINGNPVFEEGYNSKLMYDGDYIYFIGSNYGRSNDLYRINAKGGIERLTDSMQGVKGNFTRPNKLSFSSFDGVKVDSLVYSNGNEDKGVLYLHGGPDWECVNSFNPTIQFLVNKGFKVICPNYRGSTGYGKKFNHLNDKDLGGRDLLDVIIASRQLNVNRVAVTGASYGGYLTMMAMTKFPDLWCCGVAVVPFVNWFTEKQFEREVLKQYDEVKMGNDDILLRDRSPIFFVREIKAPLLILAGENDPRCPAEETLQVVEKIREMKREVRYKIYKEEGHGFAKIENYIDSVRETVEFISSNC